MTVSKQQIARALRVVRESRGLTREQASEQTDVPAETIRNWESGRWNPAAFALANYLERLGVIECADPHTSNGTGWVGRETVNPDRIRLPRAHAIRREIDDLFAEANNCGTGGGRRVTPSGHGPDKDSEDWEE